MIETIENLNRLSSLLMGAGIFFFLIAVLTFGSQNLYSYLRMRMQMPKGEMDVRTEPAIVSSQAATEAAIHRPKRKKEAAIDDTPWGEPAPAATPIPPAAPKEPVEEPVPRVREEPGEEETGELEKGDQETAPLVKKEREAPKKPDNEGEGETSWLEEKEDPPTELLLLYGDDDTEALTPAQREEVMKRQKRREENDHIWARPEDDFIRNEEEEIIAIHVGGKKRKR